MESPNTLFPDNRHRASIESIDAWLPQTQCTRCGYPRCREYAVALIRGEADINQCPPGGEATIHGLAELLGVSVKPLNPEFGNHQARRRAVIDEMACIGCRKCIDACPVDAILGAAKLMHTVIAPECTGCELCLPPCPVDCIALVPVAVTDSTTPWPEYTQTETTHWRRRTEIRQARLVRLRIARGDRRNKPATEDDLAKARRKNKIKAEIQASVARVKARRMAE